MLWLLFPPHPGALRLLLVFFLGAPFAFLAFLSLAQPPPSPPIEGAGYAFTSDGSRPVLMSVEFDPKSLRSPRPEVSVALSLNPPSASDYRWALLLYGDARFATDGRSALVLPPGASLLTAEAGDPPLSANPKKPVQVITGMTSAGLFLEGGADAVIIKGSLTRPVATTSGPRRAVVLPNYGRVSLPSLFRFPRQPGAIDIGAPGPWAVPDFFQVTVEAGRVTADERLDLESPALLTRTQLFWRDENAIQGLIRGTNLGGEDAERKRLFLLGVLAGAGASALIAALQTSWSLLRSSDHR